MPGYSLRMYHCLCELFGLDHSDEFQPLHIHLPPQILRQNFQETHLHSNVYPLVSNWSHSGLAEFGGNRWPFLRPEESGVHLGPHGHLLLHSGLFSSLSMDSSNHYGNILSEDIHFCANQHEENNGSHVLQSQPEGNQTSAHAVFHLHDFLFLLDTVCFDYCCGQEWHVSLWVTSNPHRLRASSSFHQLAHILFHKHQVSQSLWWIGEAEQTLWFMQSEKESGGHGNDQDNNKL